ncbi:CatA-like O-acetyltransferase [Aquimarina sp. 2-A2]|uniref:CatA-like O-acetyltransferase n=1 Tax=Aquimarina sp. 2-A2 TaxID=3382644 RepID=UPI00387F2AB5
MKRTRLHIEQWNRKEHYQFFSSFDEPFFGIVTEVDFTKGYHTAKEMNTSHFLYYLYCSLKAANTIDEFRYRIEDDAVYVYDQIHASPTIGREDHSFGFSFVPFHDNFETFEAAAKKEIALVQGSEGLRFNEDAKRLDTIHYSSIPWYTFSGLTHARNYSHTDSVPKISFGKYKKEGDRVLLPVAIYVHHGLMDGYHIGQYLEKFQLFLDNYKYTGL